MSLTGLSENRSNPSHTMQHTDVREAVANVCNEHLATNSPVSVGRLLKETRPICHKVREGTDIALTLFDVMCDCQPSHTLWIVAGGYATYVMKRTNMYADIDIFVQCFGTFQPKAFPMENVLINVDNNAVSFLIQGLVYEVIKVPFSVGIDSALTDKHIDMFAMHVLANFDMPICRVAIRYSLNQKKFKYVLDLTAVDFKRGPTNEAREAKYKARKIERPVQPPSLKALCLFNLFK